MTPNFSPKLPPPKLPPPNFPLDKSRTRGIPLPQHAPQKRPKSRPISLNTLLSLPHSRSPLQHTHLACALSSLPFPNKFAYSCAASLHPQLPYTPPPPSHALLFFLLCSFPLARASLPFLHAALLLLFPKSLIFVLQHAFVSFHWITRCPSIALSPPPMNQPATPPTRARNCPYMGLPTFPSQSRTNAPAKLLPQVATLPYFPAPSLVWPPPPIQKTALFPLNLLFIELCLSSTLHKIPSHPVSFLFCPPAYALSSFQAPFLPPPSKQFLFLYENLSQ